MRAFTVLGCFVVVAACTQPKPASPPAQTKVRTPVSAVPTCADMGPLLRGPMADEDSEGPKKEALIVAACERDKWPRTVLECVARANEPTVDECLVNLPPPSRERLDAVVARSDDNEESHELAQPQKIASCDDVLASTQLDAWRPAVTDGAERSVAIALRKAKLRALCDDEPWGDDVRTCMMGTPASGIDACLGSLSVHTDAAIADADALRAKIMTAKITAATCAKVVAARYADVKWKGKAPELTGAARKQAIAASRTAMLASCRTGWLVEARACMVLDGRDACFALAGEDARQWGYPATTIEHVLPPTGIPECDEYGAAITEMAVCDQLPEQDRQQLLDAFTQASAGWKNLTPSTKRAAISACIAGARAVRRAAQVCQP